MPRTREIRKRIGSVRTIRKITHTMERVAQSKGMKIAGRLESARAFRADLLRLLPDALGAIPGTLLAEQEMVRHPLGELRTGAGPALLFCVTSSRGLCGAYNARVIQAVEARAAHLASQGRAVVLGVVGRKGLAYYRYHHRPVALPVPDADENVPFSRVSDVARDLMERFERKEIDGVEVINTRTKTRFRHEVTGATLLPYRAPPATPGTAASGAAAPGAEGATRRDRGQDSFPLVEPGRTEVLARLLPLLVEADLLCFLLEAMSCEQAERSLAMRSASDSAEAMTKQLTRTYNRARQAQITNEMIEIISGSEGGRA